VHATNWSASCRSPASCCAARCWSGQSDTRKTVRNARAAKATRFFVLTVTYPGHRTRQISVRRERVDEVRRWLSNYQELREAIEAICELNHDLLRPERAVSKARRKPRD
jgi:hypothetical protein